MRLSIVYVALENPLRRISTAAMPFATQGWLTLVVVAAASAAFMFFSWVRNAKKAQARQAIAVSKFANQRTVAVAERLSAALPGKVFARSQDAFVASIVSYWSTQERDIIPHCVVRPTSVEDVQEAIRIVAADFNVASSQGSEALQFAVRSGGHGPNAFSANVQGGITIDLSQLSFVQISEDRLSTAIGPGARWIDVYQKLDPLGLTVTGGRASNPGVGGLALGGRLIFSVICLSIHTN